jgi:hypothetical protein
VPWSVNVLAGAYTSGNVAGLSADDGSYYAVSSVGSSAQWSASLTGMPFNVGSLTVTYNGHASAACTQIVYLWNWYYNAWVPISSTTAGSSDATLSLPAPGLLSDYLFLGETRVSVQCFRADAAAFILRSDLLRVDW